MGAFFLYRKQYQDELLLDDMKTVFRNKGFQSPKRFEVNGCVLYLYQKQLVDIANYVTDQSISLFAVGTLVYCGLGYQASLERLFKDFAQDSVQKEQLVGNYCLLFFNGERIQILNDALNVYEMFMDGQERFLTSSFLAAAAAHKHLTICRMACLEKLTTGYIVGEETLFQEVHRVIPSAYTGHVDWDIAKWPPINVPEVDRDRNKSIDERADKIVRYFKQIENLAKEWKAELGLSSGYDSRMLYAASLQAWSFPLDAHTHGTDGVHDVERKLVVEMSKAKGTKLRINPTRQMDTYSEEEIEQILTDGYYFFDGRCAYNMGAFSPVYTRQYKSDTIGEHRLTLNGLGGEVYRNYYMNLKPFVSTLQWMKAKVYSNGIEYVLDKAVFRQLHAHICRKMNALLPFSWGKVIDKFSIRRYYSEMRMPDCDALNCNAHNQLVFYLTPFIDRDMVIDAYKGRRMIGSSGQYQADIIARIDPIAASAKSHYGFTFDKKEPFSHRLYMVIRGLLPDSIWNLRIKRVIKRSATNKEVQYYSRVAQKSAFLRDAVSYAQELLPEVNFDSLRKDYAMMPNSSYISIVLYMLREKLNGH